MVESFLAVLNGSAFLAVLARVWWIFPAVLGLRFYVYFKRLQCVGKKG